YLLPGDQQEALAIDSYARNVNAVLARLYRASKFRVARVDEAFKTYDTAHTTTLAGQSGPVPVAVAEVCTLTWMGAPAPVGASYAPVEHSLSFARHPRVSGPPLRSRSAGSSDLARESCAVTAGACWTRRARGACVRFASSDRWRVAKSGLRATSTCSSSWPPA